MTKFAVGIVLLAVAGLFVALPALAQEGSITDSHLALSAALDQKDAATVWQKAHEILDAAAKREAQSLTGPELYAIGVAHYYLVAESLDLALKLEGLTPEQVARGTAMRDRIMSVAQQNPAAEPAAPGAAAANAQTPAANPPKLRVVGQGQQINLQELLVPGQTTVVDFFSEYCGPCRTIAPRLAELAAKRPDIYVVKVDINRPGVKEIDWQSPTARQFNLSSIPHLKIYDGNRALVAEGEAAFEMFAKWCEQ